MFDKTYKLTKKIIRFEINETVGSHMRKTTLKFLLISFLLCFIKFYKDTFKIYSL